MAPRSKEKWLRRQINNFKSRLPPSARPCVALVVFALTAYALHVVLDSAVSVAYAVVRSKPPVANNDAALVFAERESENASMPVPQAYDEQHDAELGLASEALQNATEPLRLEDASKAYAESAARSPGALNREPEQLHTYVDVHSDFGTGESGKARLLRYKEASLAVDETGVGLTHGCPPMRFGKNCATHLCTARAYLPGRNWLARARNRDDHDGAWFRRKALLRLMLRGKEYKVAAALAANEDAAETEAEPGAEATAASVKGSATLQDKVPLHVRPVVYKLDPILGFADNLLGAARVLAQALLEDRPIALLDIEGGWAARHAAAGRSHENADVNRGVCSTIGVNMSNSGGHRDLPKSFDCFINPLPFYTASITRFGSHAALTRPPRRSDTARQAGEEAAATAALLRMRHGGSAKSAKTAATLLQEDLTVPPPPRMWYAQPPPVPTYHTNAFAAPPPPPKPGYDEETAIAAAAAAREDEEAMQAMLNRIGSGAVDLAPNTSRERQDESVEISAIDKVNGKETAANVAANDTAANAENSTEVGSDGSSESFVIKDSNDDGEHATSEDLGLPGRRHLLRRHGKPRWEYPVEEFSPPPPDSTFRQYMRYYHANASMRHEIRKGEIQRQRDELKRLARGDHGKAAIRSALKEAFREHEETRMKQMRKEGSYFPEWNKLTAREKQHVEENDKYIYLSESRAVALARKEAKDAHRAFVAPPMPPLPEPPKSLEDISIDATHMLAGAQEAKKRQESMIFDHDRLGSIIVGAGTSSKEQSAIERMRDQKRRGRDVGPDQRVKEPGEATPEEIRKFASEHGINVPVPPLPPILRPLEPDSTVEEPFFYTAEGRSNFVAPPPTPNPPVPRYSIAPPPPPPPPPPGFDCSLYNICPPTPPTPPTLPPLPLPPPAPPPNATDRLAPLNESDSQLAAELLRKAYGAAGRGVGHALAPDLAEGVAEAPGEDVGSEGLVEEGRIDLDEVDAAIKASLSGLERLTDGALEPFDMLDESAQALLNDDRVASEAAFHSVASAATPAWLGASRMAFDDFRRMWLSKPSASSEWVFAQAVTLLFTPTVAVKHLASVLTERVGYTEQILSDREEDAKLYADVPYRWPRFPTVGILAVGASEMGKRGGKSNVGSKCIEAFVKKKCSKDVIAIKDVEKTKGGEDKQWRNVLGHFRTMFKALGPNSVIQNVKMSDLTNKKGEMKMKEWEKLKISKCDLTEAKGDPTAAAKGLRKKYEKEAIQACFLYKDFIGPARSLATAYDMSGFRIVSDDPKIVEGIASAVCRDGLTCDKLVVGRNSLNRKNAADDPTNWDFEKVPKKPRLSKAKSGAGKRQYDAWMMTHGAKLGDGEVSQRWAAALHLLRGADAIVGLSSTAKLPLLLIEGRTGTMPPYILLDAPPPRVYPPCYDTATAEPFAATKLAAKKKAKFCAAGSSHRSFTLINDCVADANGAVCRNMCRLGDSEEALERQIARVNEIETTNVTVGYTGRPWTYKWGGKASGMTRAGVFYEVSVAEDVRIALTMTNAGKNRKARHGINETHEKWFEEQTRRAVARGAPSAPTGLRVIERASAENVTDAIWEFGRIASPMHGGYAVLAWDPRSLANPEELLKTDIARYEVEIASEPCKALAIQREANYAHFASHNPKAAAKLRKKKKAFNSAVGSKTDHPCRLRPPQHVLNCEPYDGPDCKPELRIGDLARGPTNRYSVRVRSLNQAGYSPWSSPLNFDIPAAPPIIEEAPRVVEHAASTSRDRDIHGGGDINGALLEGGITSSLRRRGFGLQVDVTYGRAKENGEPALEAEVVLAIGTGAVEADFDRNPPSSPDSKDEVLNGNNPAAPQLDIKGTLVRASHLAPGPGTAVIGDLIPGALYYARARARSEAGWGPFSPSVSFRTPTAAQLAQRSGAKRAWRAPSLGHSPPPPWAPEAPAGTEVSMAIPEELSSWASG